MHRLVKHYDRKPLWGRASITGAMVTVVGLLMDGFVHRLFAGIVSHRWLVERLYENLIEGLIMGFVMYGIMKSRDKRLKQRCEELRFLNHHIRNALQVISLAHEHEDESKRTSLVFLACQRIQRCLERVSYEEDLSGIDNHPTEP